MSPWAETRALGRSNMLPRYFALLIEKQAALNFHSERDILIEKIERVFVAGELRP